MCSALDIGFLSFSIYLADKVAAPYHGARAAAINPSGLPAVTKPGSSPVLGDDTRLVAEAGGALTNRAASHVAGGFTNHRGSSPL